MNRVKKLSKFDRIKAEERRLNKICKGIDQKRRDVAAGLIQRAAYMRVTLEEYEDDLDSRGYVEMFSQSEKTDPYERERPVARLYNTMNKNYQTIVKQLQDLLPKTESVPEADGFDDFVSERQDL